MSGGAACCMRAVRVQPIYSLFEVQFSLSHNVKFAVIAQFFNRIDITVYEARQLTLDSNAQTRKDNRLEVQVEVKHNKRSLGSSETKSRNEIVNPYFNEKMSFSTKTYPVDELCAVCRLRRHGRMGTKHTLGSVTLGGNQDISTGRKQWDEMVKTPGKTYVMWHTLVRNPKEHSS
ncbi:hypothetical protein FGIG_00578 [Fasciola gigantica]|uniref:C2 domain-containing protein n=1 Tax=Fasciola gigantica TaxID=46835 RepID=A0A504YFI0_FASGI|nr:hypothetical protein FGIG_00578 [Fasciola gigantica]